MSDKKDIAFVEISEGMQDVISERRRQISDEGFDVAHDEQNINGQLAQAAACYAVGAWVGWPWDPKWWKPKNRRRDLVRAAALIVAEIDRIDRKNGELQ